MGKIAFVFPGQGAQYPGMGKSLYEENSDAKIVFESADIERAGTSAQCFNGSEADLAITENTQPCMFACELAAAHALSGFGIRPDMTAGFSLGEVAALTFSGALSLRDGMRLVTLRGKLMQKEALKSDTAMAAVVKLSNEQVEAICSDFEKVYPVNYNCPGQITVAGLRESLGKGFSDAVKAAGGRAIPLKVGGGFHSPFMAQASEEFGRELEHFTFSEPQIPLYSNYTGLPYAGDVKALLSKQICNPVRWENLIRHISAQGADTFIELGPGMVLTGMIKKILPEARLFNIDTAEDLITVKNEIGL